MGRSNTQVAFAVLLAAVAGFVVALVAFGKDTGNNAAVVTTNGTTTTATTGATAATTATTGTSTSSLGTSQSEVQTTTTATTSTPATTPATGPPTVASCIALWNQANNRGAQTYMVNLAARQPIRVHVGETSEVPPKCLITVIANDGAAYVFPEGGGTTYPYAPAPSQTTGGSLPVEQRKANALEQRDGTLTAL
jgi:hypothetical protein